MSNSKRKRRQKTSSKEFSDAVCKGDVRTVKAILEKGKVHVDFTQALYKASEAGHVSVVQELIRARGDGKMSHLEWGRALLTACKYGRSLEVVEELLKAGAKVDLQNSCGESALLLLFESSSITSERKSAIARVLLEANCNVNVRVGDTSALFLACENDIPDEILTLIVASGADLAATTSCGMSALHLCINRRSSIEKMRVLLQNGIDVNGKTKDGTAPLLQVMRASGAVRPPVVQELIKAGADVNMSHSLEGRTFTPLQAACNYGCCAEVIQELLKAGAKVDLQDDSGTSALLLLLESTHISSESKVPIARLLLAARCDVNVRVKDTTALFLACENDIPDEIFTLIVTSGADLTLKTEYGLNALNLCIDHRSSTEKIRVLVKNGINVNGKSRDRETPLLQAVQVGDLAIVQELIKAGADVNMSCSLWGKTSTPLRAACIGGQYLVIKELLQAGANANLCDSYGKLPLLCLL